MLTFIKLVLITGMLICLYLIYDCFNAIYWYTRAIIIKYNKLGGLNNKTLFFHSSG